MPWDQLLVHPALQSSLVPFVAGLVLAALFVPLGLSGIGATGGWLVGVYVIGDFAFEPLTATRKIVIVCASAVLIGVLSDLALKPARATRLVLVGIFAVTALWVFSTVLAQQPAARALGWGAACTTLALLLTTSMMALKADPVRAAAAGLGLGLGAGIAAILGASALLGQYGLALGSACGGVLLLAMVMRGRIRAGASLVLPVAVTAALLASGAVLLAQLDWWSAAALAGVPHAVRLPLAEKAPVWVQACMAALYAVLAAAGVSALAYLSIRGS